MDVLCSVMSLINGFVAWHLVAAPGRQQFSFLCDMQLFKQMSVTDEVKKEVSPNKSCSFLFLRLDATY